ncbi:MAG: MarR family transcriptional regulator [Thermoleophilaceae bacterium]|nr:MarR family transcriptional regulator [Thermoleophilaceae bacterium]
METTEDAVTSAPAPLLNDEELAAWRGLFRSHARLTRALDVDLVSAHGLPLTSYEVLLYLADSPEGRLRMSELADSVLLSRSGLTRLVDRLERQGLLRRETCSSDRRGAYAAITQRGRALFDRARVTHLEGVRRRFLDQLSEEELRFLGDIWRRTTGG